jgi:hypothetical protein
MTSMTPASSSTISTVFCMLRINLKRAVWSQSVMPF